MRVITKRADELAEGDIFTGMQFPHPKRHVVLKVVGEPFPGHWRVLLGTFGNVSTEEVYDAATLSRNSMIAVEAGGELTLAQQHADKLLEVARGYLEHMETKGGFGITYVNDLRVLLDELDPPQPVTLDEALDLLRKLERDQWTEAGERHKIMMSVRALLARVPGERNA